METANATLREYDQNISSNYLHIFTPEIRVGIALRPVNAGFTNIEIFSCVHPNKLQQSISFISFSGVALQKIHPWNRGGEKFESTLENQQKI